MTKKSVSHRRKPVAPKPPEGRMPAWLAFLAYLAYLRATRTQQSPEVGVLRMLIVVTALILVVIVLASTGNASAIPTVLKNWHLWP